MMHLGDFMILKKQKYNRVPVLFTSKRGWESRVFSTEIAFFDEIVVEIALKFLFEGMEARGGDV